jgi:hypothetical protein
MPKNKAVRNTTVCRRQSLMRHTDCKSASNAVRRLTGSKARRDTSGADDTSDDGTDVEEVMG